MVVFIYNEFEQSLLINQIFIWLVTKLVLDQQFIQINQIISFAQPNTLLYFEIMFYDLSILQISVHDSVHLSILLLYTIIYYYIL